MHVQLHQPAIVRQTADLRLIVNKMPLERSIGRSAMAFTVGVTCAGAIQGGIAGAAQAVVDAIAESKRPTDLPT
jgi:hypothetical protein